MPLVWDNHGCLPLRLDDQFLPELYRYKRAGVDVVSVNVTFDMMAAGHGLEVVRFFTEWIGTRPDVYVAKTVSDLTASHNADRLAVVFDIEGACAVEHDLAVLDEYADLAVRTISAAYNLPNRVGGGCLRPDDGLTALGREFVRRAERAGVVVCCSHTGYRTSRDIIEMSTNPVVFSHSNPRAMWDHPRNIPDELISLCAQSGGVVGINGVDIFLGTDDLPVDTLVKHVKYVADLVGVEHVGIALDYSFDSTELEDFFVANREMFPSDAYGDALDYVEPEAMPAIADELSRSGFARQEIDRVMGLNWLRVAEQVWT